jgi:hypothetical protein
VLAVTPEIKRADLAVAEAAAVAGAALAPNAGLEMLVGAAFSGNIIRNMMERPGEPSVEGAARMAQLAASLG